MGKCLAVITARGGSKRIPNKNIKEFCGKPIIQYSIEAALNCKIFDEIMVSTDSVQIKKIAEQCGAKVPFMRSVRTASDTATTADVVLEVLEEYKKRGIDFEITSCIYPTAPFITVEKLKRALELLDKKDVDSVMPVVAYSFPPKRGMYIREGCLVYCYPEYIDKRSQDIEVMYHDCGQFYFIKTEAFLNEKKLVTQRTEPLILSELEVQDIDTLEDWMLAEIKYKMYSLKEEGLV